ncbi:MAG: type II secretion system F family protein [Candidatus Omnitrophica bacterium]|nr:type II secretion system F family protein [Candidatus Omnitrophota bacterium]
MFAAALLFSLSMGLLVWYFATSQVENKIIKRRTEKFSTGETPEEIRNAELLKDEFAYRKGHFRRYFEFSVHPSFKQLVMFSIIWVGLAVFVFVKLEIAVLAKIVLLLFAGMILMRVLSKAAVKARSEELKKELPGALELVVICMESGLSINAAFLRVSNELHNSPLGLELRQTFNEIEAGATLEDALRDFAKRTGMAEVNAIAVSIVQAQKMGTPISGTLRVQVDSLREKMKMQLKEQIMKIPIKILFPLIFFIFPVLFILILGPAVISVFERFVGKV